MIAFAPTHTVVVTGASSGIGRAICLLLNSLGANVIAQGRNAARLRSLKEAAHSPEQLHLEQRDLTEDMATLGAWIGSLRERYGKLYGLVNSAGSSFDCPIQSYSLEAARALFDLNFHAPMLLVQAFVDRRNNQGKGSSIVNIAAMAGLCPTRGMGVYGGSKAALANAMAAVSQEVAPRGIRVHCLSPGHVASPMLDSTFVLYGPEFEQTLRESYPLGLGTPEDVAHMTAFLLSDKAGWLSGQNYLMTGGR